MWYLVVRALTSVLQSLLHITDTCAQPKVVEQGLVALCECMERLLYV